MKSKYEFEITRHVEEYYNMLSDINKNFRTAYEKFSKLCNCAKDRNFYNWRDSLNPPSKNSIIKLLLDTSQKNQNTDIDFVKECSILLKSAGYSPLHERNPEDLLIKFCLKNNMSYKEYANKRNSLDDALAKDLNDTQYNEELFEYIRSNKSKKGTLSEEEILEFENFIMHDDSKMFSKTRLSIIRYFSHLTEERRREKVPTYTTRWIRDNVEPHIPSDSFENFNHYLKNNCKLLTRARNSTIRVLVDALFSKYKNQGLSNVSINRIACDFEEFYFSVNEDDLITKNPSRENRIDHRTIQDNYKVLDGKTVLFRTDRFLADVLKGKQKLSRTSLIQWLLFCELSIPDIDDYLEQAQFFPITGYEEKDGLSNMISFLYDIKNNHQVNISTLLINTYEILEGEAQILGNDCYRFPLRDINS